MIKKIESEDIAPCRRWSFSMMKEDVVQQKNHYPSPLLPSAQLCFMTSAQDLGKKWTNQPIFLLYIRRMLYFIFLKGTSIKTIPSASKKNKLKTFQIVLYCVCAFFDTALCILV